MTSRKGNRILTVTYVASGSFRTMTGAVSADAVHSEVSTAKERVR